MIRSRLERGAIRLNRNRVFSSALITQDASAVSRFTRTDGVSVIITTGVVMAASSRRKGSILMGLPSLDTEQVIIALVSCLTCKGDSQRTKLGPFDEKFAQICGILWQTRPELRESYAR